MTSKRLSVDKTEPGDDEPGAHNIESFLLASANSRDQSIDRIARSVENLAGDFNRKLDEAERDTRRQFETFSSSVTQQFQNVTNRFDNAMAARDAKFEQFSTKVLEGRQAPWALLLTALSVVVLIMGAIGGLAYSPISQRTTNTERALEKIADNQSMMREFVVSNFVTQKELDTRTDRAREERDRTNRVIEKLQESVFPRAVHEQRWTRFEADDAAIGIRMDTLGQGLQREIDTIQRGLGETYTARDALLENKDRLNKLEEMIRDLAARRGSMP